MVVKKPWLMGSSSRRRLLAHLAKIRSTITPKLDRPGTGRQRGIILRGYVGEVGRGTRGGCCCEMFIFSF